MDTRKKKRIYRYLYELRESGDVNMVMAPMMVAKAFQVTREEAREVFWEWANSLKDEEE